MHNRWGEDDPLAEAWSDIARRDHLADRERDSERRRRDGRLIALQLVLVMPFIALVISIILAARFES